MNIQAILIGIEKYDGNDPDLNGPTCDVYEMSTWLTTTLKVPPSNLQILLSPLEKNRSKFDELAELIQYIPQPATASNILQAFFREMTGDFLYVYWSGHGFMYGDQRRLLCADATSKYFSNHNLDELLKSARTKQFKNFSRQLWIIDSCANFLEGRKSIPPNQAYQQGESFTPEQLVFYSSAPGQKSYISPTQQLSWFTLEFIQYLKDLPNNEAWFASIEAAYPYFQQRFETLKAQGLTPQIPTYLRFRGRLGNEESTGEYNPASNAPFKTFQRDLIKDYIRLQKAFKSKDKYVRSAWNWLLPTNNPKSLEVIHQDLGATEHIQEFFERLQDICMNISDEHPCLSIWIRCKLATLDYEHLRPNALPSDLSAVSAEINFLLLDIVSIFHIAPDMARQKAKKIIIKALDSANQAVMNVISSQPSSTYVWSNLMLPLPASVMEAKLFETDKAQSNISKANDLWQVYLPAPTRLVVVVETREEPEHLGFWVPIFANRQEGTTGATSAYYTGQGSAIFNDDLPLFGKDLDKAEQKEWENYVETYLQEQVSFISIPFFLKTENDKRKVLAVLNVHFYAADPEICRRAYDKEWLKIAQRQASAFICEAYKAAMIMYARDEDGLLPTIGVETRFFPFAVPSPPTS